MGPGIAQDEMTHLDILNSARLNPHQKRRSQTTLLLFYVPFHLLHYPPSVTLNCLLRPLFYYCLCVFEGLSGKWKWLSPLFHNCAWLSCLLSLFLQRGSDELSMYNSPNSGMSSISGEFVPTTTEQGGAWRHLQEAIWSVVTDSIKWNQRINRCLKSKTGCVSWTVLSWEQFSVWITSRSSVGGHPHTTACDWNRHSRYHCILMPPHCLDDTRSMWKKNSELWMTERAVRAATKRRWTNLGY